MLLVAACLLAAGAFVFLQNDKQGAPVAQDSGAPAAKIKGKAVPNPIDLHEGEDQPAPHVEVSPDSNSIQANALKAEPAVSEAAKDTLGKSSLYWKKLGHYAGINRLIEAGRWDEILRMVRDGEFGVNQPVNPAKMTLMEIALRELKMDVVRKLYELGADLEPPGRDLIAATAMNGNIEGLQFLADHGVDLSGDSGLWGLRAAIIAGNIEMLDFFLEQGVSPWDIKSSKSDALSLAINSRSFGKMARRLMEEGFELRDVHVYEVARTANPAMVSILLEEGYDLENLALDQRQLKLESHEIFRIRESQGEAAFPDLFVEGETFMDAVINSEFTDVTFLQYLETQGLYANQAQLERLRELAEQYGTQVVHFENGVAKSEPYYPYAAEVAEYIAQQLNQ